MAPFKVNPELASRRGASAWRNLIALAAILALCASTLSVALSGDGPRSWHEAVTIRSSHETWLRVHDEISGAWVIPYIDGRPRIVKPPMMVWLNILAWTGLEPDTFGQDHRPLVDALITRARLVAVLLALITIASVYMIGTRLLDARWGLIAAGMLGTLPMFQQYARSASYDIGLLAGTTVAIAGAVCAMTQERSRQWFARWMVCGLALAFAWLSKGPLALLIVAGAVVPMILLLRHRMKAGFLGLALAIAIAGILAVPWYFALSNALEHHSLTGELANEYEGPGIDARPPWYYIRHVNWTLPWALFFLSGLLHPWVGSQGAERRVRLGPWFWFLVLIVLFSCAAAKVQRYVLPLAPAVALVAALVWRDHDARYRSGQRAGAAWIHWIHWTGCALAAAGFTAVAVWPGELVRRHWLPENVARLFSSLPAIPVAILSSILVLLSVAGLVLTKSRQYLLTSMIAISWAAIFTGLMLRLSVSMTEASRFEGIHRTAIQIEAVVGDAALHAMKTGGIDGDLCRVGLLLNRAMPALTNSRLKALAEESEQPFYVLTTNQAQSRRLERRGGERVLGKEALSPPGYELWRAGGGGMWRRERE